LKVKNNQLKITHKTEISKKQFIETQKQLIERRTECSTVHKQPIEYQKQLIEKHSRYKTTEIQLIESRKQLIEQKFNQFQRTTPNSKRTQTVNVTFQVPSKIRFD